MPRRNFEDGSEIVIDDFNSLTKAIERGLFDRTVLEMLQRKENAFFGDSFTVTFASANSVNVKKGNGFMTDAVLASPEPTKRPLYLSADSNEMIPAPDSVNDRIDIVCVKATLVNELSGQRKVKDAISDQIQTQTLVVQKDWSAEILIVEGTPAVAPVAPATPAGYVKIAELAITAVIGMAGADAVTDTRELLPVGDQMIIDTTGKQRIAADPGADTTLAQILVQIDSLLKRGHQEFIDMDELADEPDAPEEARQRFYILDGVAYMKDSEGSVTPLGSGGGGGGGANWQPKAGAGPLESMEYDEKVWKFEKDAGQALVLWVRVPASYLPGRQVKMKTSFYSPSSTMQWCFQTYSRLIRKNNDAITSVANSHYHISAPVVNAVSNRVIELEFLLSEVIGTINSLAVSPGDLIKIEISRTATGTDDTEDIRFIPSATEVLFS